MKKITVSLMAAAMMTSALAMAAPAWAADNVGKTLSVMAGQAPKQIRGSIRGEGFADYIVHARAGQTLDVSMTSSSAANYFNLLRPGSDEALANGSLLGNKWSGALPADGDYRVRVYLMRSAARRNEAARFTLTLSLHDGARPDAALRHDAKVAGTPYHATGRVPCSVGPDPKGSAQCSFGVIRKGSGRAEVHLASPGQELQGDGIVLEFDGSRVSSASAKQRVFGRHHGDEWEINVNDFYFFNLPDALINGG